MATSLGTAFLTLISGQIASNLAWIMISAEDAPDLLRCAPAMPSLARRCKLTAALIPFGILVIPMGLFARLHPLAAIAATLGVAASALSDACIQLLAAEGTLTAQRIATTVALFPALSLFLLLLGRGREERPVYSRQLIRGTLSPP